MEPGRTTHLNPLKSLVLLQLITYQWEAIVQKALALSPVQVLSNSIVPFILG
jgi:hypothetical protein